MTVRSLGRHLRLPPQTSPRYYSGRPFGKFFALLSQERCVVEETLRWFEKLWTVMTAAEEQATDEPYLRKFLASLQFPGYTVDRELLISLAETLPGGPCGYESGAYASKFRAIQHESQ